MWAAFLLFALTDCRRYLETSLVKKYLTPENAPSLQVLEVNWEMMDYHDKMDLAEWRCAMECIRYKNRLSTGACHKARSTLGPPTESYLPW